MSLSKEQLKEYREDINKALEDVAKKHGMESLRLGNIKYGDSFFEGKVEATFTKSKEQIKEEMDIVKSQLKYLGISEKLADYSNICDINAKVIDFKRVNAVLEDKDGLTYNIKIDMLKRLFPAK